MILFRAIEFIVSLASLKGTLMRMMPRVASSGRAGRWGSRPHSPRRCASSWHCSGIETIELVLDLIGIREGPAKL